MKNRITVSYSSGWRLTFPADGLGPRLFLEWIAEYQKKKSFIYPAFNLSNEIRKDEQVFIIKFTLIGRSELDELASYLKDNV